MQQFKEYRKTSTVKAKLFEKGDENGMTTPKGFTSHDAMENEKFKCPQPEQVPYISTLENQIHRGEFGKHYLCIGIKGEKWLVEKEIFESTYEPTTTPAVQDTGKCNCKELQRDTIDPDLCAFCGNEFRS